MSRYRPKSGEVNRLVSSKNRAFKILKWKPIYDNKKNFTKALTETVKWYSSNLKFYESKYKIYNI